MATKIKTLGKVKLTVGDATLIDDGKKFISIKIGNHLGYRSTLIRGKASLRRMRAIIDKALE